MKPYKFQPYLKTTIWGGYQIAPFKGIFNAQPNVGESWEISGVPGHESVAINRGLVNDVDEGLTLVELIDKYKELLVGKKIYKKFGNQFPLLVKFIDSRQDLSVQVHPDDKLAMERHGCAGKTEMWYIIKSDVGSKIYSGLRKSITPEEYEQLATAEPQNGRSPMQDVIATHEAHEGDLYFLPAGRLHAIGAGNFLAEILPYLLRQHETHVSAHQLSLLRGAPCGGTGSPADRLPLRLVRHRGLSLGQGQYQRYRDPSGRDHPRACL